MMMKPAWLEGLTGESFFGICGFHENKRKNEKNIYCLDCCQSFCPHCLPSHHSHPLLQPYTINSAKVIFLNPRAQTRSCKGPANSCFTCDRILQEPFHFCSLSCKVDHMMYQGEDLSGILCRFDATDFAFSQLEGLRMDGLEFGDEDGQTTPESILEEFKDSSGSDNGTITYKPEVERKKKKKNNDFIPKFFSFGNRRKGAPQRSPLS